jgi:hypothetical protein
VLDVGFAPTAAQSYTGTMVLTDTASGSPQQVPISGQGVRLGGAGFDLSPNPVTDTALFTLTGQQGMCSNVAPSFSHPMILEVKESLLLIDEPTIGVQSTGTINASGVFSASNASERYDGQIDSTGSGTATSVITNGSCQLTYHVTLTPSH